jgi:hypothetical protein
MLVDKITIHCVLSTSGASPSQYSLASANLAKDPRPPDQRQSLARSRWLEIGRIILQRVLHALQTRPLTNSSGPEPLAEWNKAA